MLLAASRAEVGSAHLGHQVCVGIGNARLQFLLGTGGTNTALVLLFSLISACWVAAPSKQAQAEGHTGWPQSQE